VLVWPFEAYIIVGHYSNPDKNKPDTIIIRPSWENFISSSNYNRNWLLLQHVVGCSEQLEKIRNAVMPLFPPVNFKYLIKYLNESMF